jgi:peptidyl-prolyl cis-trans isomerase D
MVKIVLGVVLGLVSVGMLLYLVPQPNTPLSGGSETLANVAGQQITVSDVQQQLNLMSQQQQIPQQLRGFYAQQIFDQMVFNRVLTVEAARLGLKVSNQELADTIRQILPQAFPDGKWIGEQAYSEMVQQGFGLSVQSFENQLRQSILQQKFRQLVTAGITVSPEEVREAFLRQNEKVKIDYVLVKPSDLAAKLHPSQSELEAWYKAHMSEYQVPEQRAASYLLLDRNLLQKSTTIPEQQMLAYYQKHIDLYRVPARANVQHILFMTMGKTSAQIALLRKKAEMVLNKLQHGASFSKMAKEYSDDPGSKDKGGHLGWILRGQTVSQFQHVAFTLPVGQISNIVQTQYGLEIIKVLAREEAHTKSFAEVSSQILHNMSIDRVAQEAEQISSEMADVVRNSNRQSIAAVEAAVESAGLGPEVKASLVAGETPLVTVTEPIGRFGNSQTVRNALFAQSLGQLSLPMRVQDGYLILLVNKVVPAHQGTFAEVHDRVLSDYLKAKSAELAQSDAAQIASRLQKAEQLAAVAKSFGLTVQTADFSRTGNVANAPASKFLAAFSAPVGKMQGPEMVGQNWIVYTVAAHEKPSEAAFERQRSEIRQELLTTAQDNAFDAFRRALEDQMKRQGKYTVSAENLKQLTNPSQS